MIRYRKKLPFKVRLLIVFGVAAVAVFAAIAAVYLAGYRYITCHRLNGTDVKFVGKVDKEGKPLSGMIIYPDMSRAKVSYPDGKIEYSSGASYTGGLSVTYERDGEGTMTFANGDRYTGHFTADVIDGKGRYEYASGDVYEGDFVMGVKEGTGKYVYADGETYEGGFSADMRNGTGRMTKPDGTEYEGDYVFGIKNGKGIYRFANGDVYEGDFSLDMRHGQGKYTWANGESYEGEFSENNINGYGTYTWVEGRASYTGYFENGTIVLVSPDGSTGEGSGSGDGLAE
ncbi:MAG: hypothetical protein K5647_04615 [Clostridiales bacterium]|nr:hypothetical protein [Clostridiales bacterium]